MNQPTITTTTTRPDEANPILDGLAVAGVFVSVFLLYFLF